MKNYENNNGNLSVNAKGLICSTTEFTQTTDEEDGATLMVVNETSHVVQNYYVAFNGYWNEL